MRIKPLGIALGVLFLAAVGSTLVLHQARVALPRQEFSIADSLRGELFLHSSVKPLSEDQ